uniref:DNA-directed RNA polymerase subunit beta n=1 Tax=Marvania geminata TaxID=97105 RepID=A0A097KR82_9CHLO|nr:beta subunit of RNA polymerase [Marvania geminata]AIT95695.1 beta subunit of RNA polymerase [Marvania geminata]
MADKITIASKETKFFPVLPDLVGLQYGSFQQFVAKGFVEALNPVNPLICKYGENSFTLRFFPEKIQFTQPKGTEKDALKFGKTYGCCVYIPTLLTSTQWTEPRMEWVFLGFLPIMTKAGHFVINGIPRVVLYQMIRTPGVYKLWRDSRTGVPTVRIVPEQGSWLNITIDKKNKVWVTTRLLRRKISVLVFLQALGISFKELQTRLDQAHLLNKSLLKSLNTDLESTKKTRQGRIYDRAKLTDHPQTQAEACRYIYAHVQEYSSIGRDQPITNETALKFFQTVVWNEKTRNLGVLGREQFRGKLGSVTPKNHTFVTADDMVRATGSLLDLLSGKKGDDIDSLTNKRVRGCQEFLKDQLVRGVREFEAGFTRKLLLGSQNDVDTVWKYQKSSLAKSVSKAWKSFFTSGTLAQFLDETNPLAETTHKRRMTVLGPGGVSGKQSTIQIRGIHPTYYGRLCPIETPEGQNAGLVNSLTVFSRPNSLGFLETPFYTVYRGQVQKLSNPKFYVPSDESSFLLAPADIDVSETLTFPKTKIPVRKNLKFEYGMWNQITNQSIGILQMISIATSLIPFLEHDDANRALMGSNMQRQAVPVIQPDEPYVQTGLESRVISDVQHSLHTNSSGYITSVNARNVKIYTPSHALPSNTTQAKLGYGKPPTDETIFEPLRLFAYKETQKSGTASIAIPKQKFSLITRHFFSNTHHLPISQVRSQISQLGSSSSVKQGKQSCRIVPSTEGLKKPVSTISFDLYQRTNQSTCKSHRPTVFEGEWVQKFDLLADGAASQKGKIALGKNILVAYLPWEGYNFEDAILISERLVREDVFTSLHLDYYELEVKNTQYGLETITRQLPIDVTDSDMDLLRIQRLQLNGLLPVGSWVEEGDYLVGKITPMNPKGPSVHHQYEKLYNVIMQRENTTVRNTSLRVPKGVEGFVFAVEVLPPKEADVSAIAPKNAILRVRVALLQRRKIQVGDKMAGRHGNKGIVSKILPEYDMPYLPDGRPVDIVLNPLGVPSRMNVGQILECLLGLAGSYLNESYTMKLFDEQVGAEASRSFVYSKLFEASVKTRNSWLFEPHHPGKMKLFDGRTGLPFDQAISVGCTYMLKLVHLVDDKIHARSTGPYSAITQQPVRGRSRKGGQRVGEMEVWALQAYGAAAILQELLTIKSDDVDGRKEAVFRIYTNQPIQFGPPESFRVLIRELQALCFDLKLFTKLPPQSKLSNPRLHASFAELEILQNLT